MKVIELIEKLSKLPPNLRVVCYDEEHNLLHNIFKVEEIKAKGELVVRIK